MENWEVFSSDEEESMEFLDDRRQGNVPPITSTSHVSEKNKDQNCRG